MDDLLVIHSPLVGYLVHALVDNPKVHTLPIILYYYGPQVIARVQSSCISYTCLEYIF
jgi:hypothetical protein